MVGKLKQGLYGLIYLRKFGGKWARPLVGHGIWPLAGASIDRQGRLIVPGLGSPIPDTQDGCMSVLRAIEAAVSLHSRTGAHFEFNGPSATVVIDSIRFAVNCRSDIGILHEIFVERIYDFELPGELLILDIGANIGAASLFFAHRFGAEVRAFELVPSTAALAQANFDQNPGIASRIAMQPFGLSDNDQEMNILVDPDDRASNTMFASERSGTGTFEKATIQDVAPLFRSAIDDLKGRKLVAKVDAEGAEYEILGRLVAEGLLEKVDVMLLEWHERKGKNPKEIRNLLRSAGFRWFEHQRPWDPVGFITAFRG